MTVSAGGAEGSPDESVAGYSIIEAPDLDTAAALVNNRPFVKRGGTLKVIESVTP